MKNQISNKGEQRKIEKSKSETRTKGKNKAQKNGRNIREEERRTNNGNACLYYI
jgi:hypothetical protein